MPKNKTHLLHGLLGCVLVAACSRAPAVADNDVQESKYHRFQAVTVVEGLEHPWSLAFLPSGEWLISERPGRLRVVRDGKLEAAPVAGVPEVVAINQGGLLDVVPHPRYADNRYVYLTYAKRCDERNNTTAVGRGRFDGSALRDFQELYVAAACAPGGRHHGSRMVFDRNGYLYVTVGDRGEQDRAQDPRDNAGVTLRLHDDGRIPEDNPFIGDDAGHDANWTWGNRNAQGMAVHPQTGEIWQHEHGPQGGDEINLIRRGVNYGWPTITYGRQYVTGARIGIGTHKEGMEQPLKQWTPSIAPSGLAFYTGDAFPQWRGDLFVGALAGAHLVRVRFDGIEEVEEEQLLRDVLGRIRDVRLGPDGLLYLLTDSPDGRLVRLQPVG